MFTTDIGHAVMQERLTEAEIARLRARIAHDRRRRLRFGSDSKGAR